MRVLGREQLSVRRERARDRHHRSVELRSQRVRSGLGVALCDDERRPGAVHDRAVQVHRVAGVVDPQRPGERAVVDARELLDRGELAFQRDHARVGALRSLLGERSRGGGLSTRQRDQAPRQRHRTKRPSSVGGVDDTHVTGAGLAVARALPRLGADLLAAERAKPRVPAGHSAATAFVCLGSAP